MKRVIASIILLVTITLGALPASATAATVAKRPTQTTLRGFHTYTGTVYLTARSSRWTGARWTGNVGHRVNFFILSKSTGRWRYLGYKIMHQQNCCPKWGIGKLTLRHIPYNELHTYIARTAPTRYLAGSHSKAITG